MIESKKVVKELKNYLVTSHEGNNETVTDIVLKMISKLQSKIALMTILCLPAKLEIKAK